MDLEVNLVCDTPEVEMLLFNAYFFVLIKKPKTFIHH